MRITALETVLVGAAELTNWAFLQVRTDAGLTGLGEVTFIGSERQVQSAIAALSHVVVGSDPRQINALTRLPAPTNGGRVEAAAVSGLEQALWDLVGKILEVPTHTLLGGAVRERIPLYANINRATRDRSPSGFAANAVGAVKDGFPAIKLAPFDGVRPGDLASVEGRRRVEQGLERVNAVREAIGPQVELMVDCHWRFNVAEALHVARELEGCRLHWIEDMAPDAALDGWSRFRQQRPERIAGGERAVGVGEFLPRIHGKVWDVACPDVKYCGGMLEMQRIAAVADAYGMPVAPHNPSGPVATLASAQVAATLNNLAFLEFAWGECPWRNELVHGAERFRGGELELPSLPGLGCELNEAIVSAHPARDLFSSDSLHMR